MNNIPIIRLELERMKQTMLTAVSDYNNQISEAVKVQLEWAIENFDYEAAVREAANEAIKEAINSYFKYGEGRRLIDQTIDEALGKIIGENGN